MYYMKNSDHMISRARYDEYVVKLSDDYDPTSSAVLSSTISAHNGPNYVALRNLGTGIVPYLIEDLRNNNGYYPLTLLEELLPDVDLDKVCANSGWRVDASIWRECWLRWWDVEGSQRNWASQ